MVHLQPTTRGQAIVKCDRELAKCQWLPIQDYIDGDNVHNVNKFFAQQFLDMRERGISIQMTEVELKIKHFVRQQQIYTLQQTPTPPKL